MYHAKCLRPHLLRSNDTMSIQKNTISGHNTMAATDASAFAESSVSPVRGCLMISSRLNHGATHHT